MVFYPGLNKLLQMLILPISCEMKVLTLMRNTTKCLVPHLHQQDLQHRHLDPLALCVTNLPLIPHPIPAPSRSPSRSNTHSRSPSVPAIHLDPHPVHLLHLDHIPNNLLPLLDHHPAHALQPPSVRQYFCQKEESRAIMKGSQSFKEHSSCDALLFQAARKQKFINFNLKKYLVIL